MSKEKVFSIFFFLFSFKRISLRHFLGVSFDDTDMKDDFTIRQNKNLSILHIKGICRPGSQLGFRQCCEFPSLSIFAPVLGRGESFLWFFCFKNPRTEPPQDVGLCGGIPAGALL